MVVVFVLCSGVGPPRSRASLSIRFAGESAVGRHCLAHRTGRKVLRGEPSLYTTSLDCLRNILPKENPSIDLVSRLPFPIHNKKLVAIFYS